MPEVAVFCEDSFHEKFIDALYRRFERDYQLNVSTRFLSAAGGLPRMQKEFARFLRDLSRDRRPYPDLVVAVVDANCVGRAKRQAHLASELSHFPQFEQLVHYAIPDPHIERWMLVDPEAFRQVFGLGCTLPGVKCAKNEYKTLLRQQLRACGVDAPLGGEEFADDLVSVMDLNRAEQENSLGLVIRQMKARFNQWRQAR